MLCGRNLLNLRYIHIIPLTGFRFLPQLSAGGPEHSGVARSSFYPDAVEAFSFKLGVTDSQIKISQGPEERVE
jgi:hypothetical protein